MPETTNWLLFATLTIYLGNEVKGFVKDLPETTQLFAWGAFGLGVASVFVSWLIQDHRNARAN